MHAAAPLLGDSNAWITPSVAIATFALLFTAGSFWWIQVRRGRLRCYTSHVYTGSFSSSKLVFVVPLVLHNPAPAPLIVIDLQLCVSEQKNRKSRDADVLPISLRWIASHTAVYPQNETRSYAAPFAVDGRKAVEKFVEFQYDNPPSTLEDGPFYATIEAIVAPRHWSSPARWRKLTAYQFNTQLATGSRANLIPRSNDPNIAGQQ